MVGAVRTWYTELVPQPGVPRRLAVLTLTQSLGSGVFLTASVVQLVQVAGLRAADVGWGLSLAGLCGFLATVPAGRLADRVGARLPLALAYLALAGLYACYGLITGYALFLVIACLVAVGEAVVSPMRSVLVYTLCRGDTAARVRAQMRSAYNLGFVLGATAAGLALAVGTRSAFVAVGVANGTAHLLCALVTRSLKEPSDAPHRRQPAASRAALRSVRFMSITVVNGALELHHSIIMVGVPLWIVSRTDAASSLNSALLVLNTVCVVLFQVAIGRNAHTVSDGARLQRLAGLLLAGACVVFALSDQRAALSAGIVLVVGSLILVFGEMAQTAGSYTLSFELPPPGRQGEYQGVFALGKGIRQTLGPALVTSLVLGSGSAGWLLLAALFIGLGLVSVPLARSAQEVGRDG